MSKEYWKTRSEQRELEAQLIASKYLAKMDERIREAQQEILQQIEVFYSRYAIENQITLAEARKYLTSKELKEFKQVNLKRFKEMSLTGNPDYERLLHAVSYRAQISRLEALNLNMEMTMTELYGGMNGLQQYTYTGLSEVYKNSFYKTMYDFAQAGTAVGTVQALANDTVKEALSYNWSGKEFSTRIWGHQETTRLFIRKELERTFASGRSLDKTARAIMKVTDASYSRAEALVRTEANFFHNLAARKAYGEADIDRYEILATLDHRTSSICREQDGKIYPDKDFKPGETAPPFHTRCRSTTIPHFDETEYMTNEKRQSMDGPIDTMTYEDWYEKNVIGNHANEAKEKMILNRFSDLKQYEKYKEVLWKNAPMSFTSFQNLKYTDKEVWNNTKGDYRKMNAYEKIIKNEPGITKDLKEISKKTGAELVGLEYRLKTKASYLRKVNSDSLNSSDSKIIDETISSTNDVIRYTYQASKDKLAEIYKYVTAEMDSKGYSKFRIKNTWKDKRSAYKGVNCIFVSPNGQKFEVQFHTLESFTLKNGKLHELYEEYRLDNTTPERRNEISKEMFNLSAKLVTPKDINEIK